MACSRSSALLSDHFNQHTISVVIIWFCHTSQYSAILLIFPIFISPWAGISHTSALLTPLCFPLYYSIWLCTGISQDYEIGTGPRVAKEEYKLTKWGWSCLHELLRGWWRCTVIVLLRDCICSVSWVVDLVLMYYDGCLPYGMAVVHFVWI